MKKITIYDIAKEANVSPTMVSRVLNKSGPVKKDKEERILKIIEKYNYVPNALARSLIKKQTKMLGLILPDIGNAFFRQIYQEVEKRALEHGYNVILCNSLSDLSLESQYLKLLVEKQVDGIIFLGGRVNDCNLKQKYIDEMNEVKKKVPIITVNNIYDEVSTINIVTDAEKGIRELVKFIAEKGYKDVGIILGRTGISSTEIRKKYFLKYVEEYKLNTKDEWLIYSGFSMDAGMKGAEKLLKVGKLPQIILCMNDLVAMGVIRKLYLEGIRVPEDIKVTGFDDIEVAEIFIPSLTTINQNYKQIGITVINSILKNNMEECNKKIFIETKLIIRESCK